MTDAELSALAARALAAAGPAVHAQARAIHERVVTATGALSAVPLEDRLVVEVACVRDGRVGVARTSSVDHAGLARVAAAAAAACAGDVVGGYPALPAPAPGRAHEAWDPAVAELEPGTLPPGLVAGRAIRTAIVSSTGIDVRERRSRVVGDDGAAAVGPAALAAARAAWDAGVSPPDAAHGPTSAPDAAHGPTSAPDAAMSPPGGAPQRLTSAPRAAVEPPGRECAAVLAPAAVAALLDALAPAFDGLAIAEGRSPLSGRLGRRVAASAVNLSESPRFPGTLARAYDAEGVPVAPVPLIQDGVAHRGVHDTRSAALAGGGAVSTGHAALPGGAPGGPRPRNLVLVGGGADGEAELLAPVADGLHVTDLDAVHPVGDGVVSALARAWAVRDGRPVAPLAPARFTGSPLAVLAAVEALTTRQRVAPSGTVCPGLRTTLRLDVAR